MGEEKRVSGDVCRLRQEAEPRESPCSTTFCDRHGPVTLGSSPGVYHLNFLLPKNEDPNFRMVTWPCVR